MSKIANLIITADDFGLCESVNDAIIESFYNNNITNTSIMVNMPNLEKNAELLIKTKLDYGLHFSVNRGIPYNRKSSLCDSDGNFLDRNQLFKKILIGKIKQIDILNEFEHQLRLSESAKLKITHFDSDNHVHFHPYIFFSILKIIIKKKLSFRSLNPLFLNFLKTKRLLRQISFKTINLMYKTASPKKIFSNNFFCSAYDVKDIFSYNEKMYFDLLKNFVDSGTIEMMVHPYYNSKELKKIYPNEHSNNFLNNCFAEANILTSKKNLFSGLNLKLNNFDYLRREYLKSL
jgi:predicted glycoside hydrolase/deacetylase ChbG (UPF0249 family)